MIDYSISINDNKIEFKINQNIIKTIDVTNNQNLNESIEFLRNNYSISGNAFEYMEEHKSEYINYFGTLDNIASYSYLENYTFKYEDENDNPLDNFLEMTYEDLLHFNEFNITPYMAAKLGVYQSDERIGYLNLGSYKKEFCKRLYRVGLMSDMHYNDSTIDADPYNTVTDDGTQYDTDLINALQYYQNNEEIRFISTAGDVSSDSKEHLRNFALMLKNEAPTTPTYSCLGNHDFQSTHYEIDQLYDDKEFGLTEEFLTRIGIWNEHITPKDNTIHFYDDTTEEGKLSYYIEREIEGTNKKDIYVYLSVDYGITHETRTTKSTWDCQGAQKMLDYESTNVQELMNYIECQSRTEMQQQYDYQFYDSNVLLWLKDIIENNSNKRIFIFTHQFFGHKAGNNNSQKYYSYIGDEYWRISQKDDEEGQIAYCLCGLQYEFLNKLNNEYKNTIWFTGHSHYSWQWQLTDSTINICNRNYNIYDPVDNDFEKENRYCRRKVITPIFDHKFSEMYFVDTDIIGLIFEKSMNVENGNYKVKYSSQASFTPDRNLEDRYTENQYNSSVRINNEIELIKTIYTTEYGINDYSIYETTINVTDNTLTISLYNDNPGANWFILNVIDIINIDTNESLIDDFYQIEYSSPYGDVPLASRNFCPIDRKEDVDEYTISAFNVHLPSLARPIKYPVTSYEVEGLNSEGAIMDIYEDYVDIRGIIFKNKNISNEYVNKYYPLAQYRINVPAGN